MLLIENQNLNKWKDVPQSRKGSLGIFKMSDLPNLVNRFNATAIVIPTECLGTIHTVLI